MLSYNHENFFLLWHKMTEIGAETLVGSSRHTALLRYGCPEFEFCPLSLYFK